MWIIHFFSCRFSFKEEKAGKVLRVFVQSWKQEVRDLASPCKSNAVIFSPHLGLLDANLERPLRQLTSRHGLLWSRQGCDRVKAGSRDRSFREGWGSEELTIVANKLLLRCPVANREVKYWCPLLTLPMQSKVTVFFRKIDFSYAFDYSGLL